MVALEGGGTERCSVLVPNNSYQPFCPRCPLSSLPQNSPLNPLILAAHKEYYVAVKRNEVVLYALASNYTVK